jgi:hypothetical protein
MPNRTGLAAGLAAIVVVAGCALDQASRSAAPGDTATAARLRPAIRAPQAIQKSAFGKQGGFKAKGTAKYQARGPSAIRLADVPRAQALDRADELPVRGGNRIESKFTDEQVAKAQNAARNQAASTAVQNVDGSQVPVGKKPKLLSSFDAIDAGDCCTGTGFAATVPPDPDMAAGPDHLIVVVNTAFEVYDTDGDSLTGPIQFATFFDPTRGGTDPGAGTPTPGCTAFAFQFGAQRSAVFDPDVVYDEVHDRFVIGIDGNGDSYCVAATTTGDPTGAWNRYGFPTNMNGAFFDFPHMGVGVDAIFMGSNQFGGALPFGFEGRVFAMDKFDMYAGAPLDVSTRELAAPGMEGGSNIKLDGTPQPMQLHGAFPPSGSKHYIMGEFFDGKSHAVYSWADPFGADDFEFEGDVDLAAASGVPCENFSCFPIPWPQKGSVEILEANDYRGQETKWRNGLLWTTQTVSCNPKKGTRDCIRWAQIDPTEVVPGALAPGGFPLVSSTNGVIQAGVFGSSNDYRTFPSIAVNRCEDMAVGYSLGSEKEYPSLFVAGRSASDPLGVIGGERRLLKGKTFYTSFQDNGGEFPERWGDYSGMTIAPDGKTFWYVGEYARPNTPNPFANWGTFVGSFEVQGCN